MSDPLPLSRGQLRALTAATMHELSWGLRAVSREMRGWRRRARLIPDGPIREDALQTLERKRTHIVGAGLFSILPGRRDRRLLRVLVAYEIILEFLDNAHERAAHQLNGRQLHRALVEALDPSAPISDYYLHHPWKDDGGYLCALVEACREGCVSLPFYEDVRRLLLQGASRCGGRPEPQPRNRLGPPWRRAAQLVGKPVSGRARCELVGADGRGEQLAGSPRAARRRGLQPSRLGEGERGVRSLDLRREHPARQLRRRGRRHG